MTVSHGDEQRVSRRREREVVNASGHFVSGLESLLCGRVPDLDGGIPRATDEDVFIGVSMRLNAGGRDSLDAEHQARVEIASSCLPSTRHCPVSKFHLQC